LTEHPTSATIPRMGRPSLKVKATVVRLSVDVRKRIEALVGPNNMAKFIREAIDAELERRQKAGQRQALPGRKSQK
jgi:hypothetical protein